MKDNTDRFYLILSTGVSNQTKIENSLIKGILCEKLFDVKFDHKLTFDQNFKSFGKKAKAKLKGLAGVLSYIVFAKINLRMNSFFSTQLNCCTLIWMIHSHFSYNQVKYLST